MIGRWIRLIEAERAITGSRWEEALDLAGHASVRAHRRAETVRRKAAEALLVRAREHLGRGELSAALGDLKCAGRAGMGHPEEARLEAEIRPRLEEREARKRLVEEALAAAQKAEKEGNLLQARERLRSLPSPPPSVAERVTALDARIAEQERLVEGIALACENGAPEAAEEGVVKLRRIAPRHPLLPSLERALDTVRRVPALRTEAERAAAGAASHAFAFLSRHAPLHPDLFKTPEGEAIVRAVREARRGRVLEHLRAGEFRAAGAQARRLAAAGESAEGHPFVLATLAAARGAEALARGERRIALDAFERAARAHPEVGAACPKVVDGLGPREEEAGPTGHGRLLEAQLEVVRRPWDAAVVEGALRLAEAEEKRSGKDPAAARIRAARPIAQRHRVFREELERGLFAHAGRELAAAVEGLRRLEDLEAAEDLRLEGTAALLEAMGERVREGKREAVAEAAHDSALEDLCEGLFEERLLGLRDAAPAGHGARKAAEGRKRDGFPWRFVIRMDEAADALVLARDEIRIGHAREPSNDLPLLARVAAAHAEIRRKVSFHEGVAYELLPAPGRPVSRNGKEAHGPVPLQDGDRVALGETFAFRFRLPSGRSRSALLELEPGCEIGGATAVILLKPGADGRIGIGGGADAHLGAGRRSERVYLFLDDRRTLLGQSEEPLLVDGAPAEGEAPLSGGEELAAGSLRFLLSRD